MANYYKTDVPCDGVEIIFEQEGLAISSELTSVGSPALVTIPFNYIVGANNIQVFENKLGSPANEWTLLSVDDYTEIDTTHITVGIYIVGDIKVIRQPGRMVEGIHYERINSRIIEINAPTESPYLWSWGENRLGRLGDGTTVDKSSPVQTISGGTDWKQISAGDAMSAAIKNDGTLWVWGEGNAGQLGDNSTVSKSSPVQTISGGTDWKYVSCGDDHTAAIKNDGTLWSWGKNNWGQLGDNSTTNKSSPVETFAGGTDWAQVSAGGFHTAAIKTNGELWLWGYNLWGGLGDTSTAHKSSPVQTVAGGTDWVSVDCGWTHTTAIKSSGELWMWGWNGSGGLGDGTIAHKSSPVQTVAGGTDWAYTSGGSWVSGAIKTDGTLWMWGDNYDGYIGDNTTTNRSSPVQTISGGTDWGSISVGGFHSTAIKTDGTLWTWGYDAYGQLGDGTTVSKSSPVQTISGGTSWNQSSSGAFHTMAISSTEDYILTEVIKKIYTRNPAKSKLNPAKIIDTEAGTVVANVPIWDPARGHHFHNAIHVANIQRGDPLSSVDEDPALYNVVVNAAETSLRAWNSNEVGKIWFDTSTLGYLPYYDDKVYPVLNDRIFNWGKLAPWASIDLYEWTESSVPPEEYDAVARVQEGDVTIDEIERVTGQSKSIPYNRTRNNFTFDVTIESSGYQTFTVPDLYGTVNESDTTGLVNNFVQQFTAVGSVDEEFTLDQPYANGQGPALIIVTQNGVPVDIIEISSTQFSLTTSADDIIRATVTAPNYTSSITIDGTLYNIVINGSVAQNYGQLINRLTDDLVLSNAVVELAGHDIKITSITTGTSSSVSIVDPGNLPLFGSIGSIVGSPAVFVGGMINFPGVGVPGVDSEVTSTGHTFSHGDEVIISSTETLPAPLVAGGIYTVYLSGSPISFQLKDSTDAVVEFTDIGTGIHMIAESTFPTSWNKEIDIHEVVDVVYKQLQGTSDPITITEFSDGDSVDVYINELLQETVIVSSSSVTLTNYTFQQQDTIRIIKAAHIIDADDESFDPDTTDDGTIHIQYKKLYNYTEVTTITENGIDEEKKYYFWVSDKSVRTIPNSALSLREATLELEEIPTPYIIFQNLKPQEITTIDLPSRYNQMILRGHSGLINADDRYILRFTRDLTLRDTLETRENQPMLKNVHTEWELFREKQQSHPRRDLWDKITESIVGYRLSDPTKRIPSRERELYDDTHDTDTRYGLGDGQIFVDGDIAKTTILVDLNNPDIDFYPTDLDEFFQTYNFDTNENVVNAMDRIYNSFSYDHVNRMLHSVMLDAFSKKAKYPDIFKTSMISLHGIRILETAGLYDD